MEQVEVKSTGSLAHRIKRFGEETEKFFALSIESDPKAIRREVIPGIDISGTRSWFLISSCLIASIGLNTNSQAVMAYRIPLWHTGSLQFYQHRHNIPRPCASEGGPSRIPRPPTGWGPEHLPWTRRTLHSHAAAPVPFWL